MRARLKAADAAVASGAAESEAIRAAALLADQRIAALEGDLDAMTAENDALIDRLRGKKHNGSSGASAEVAALRQRLSEARAERDTLASQHQRDLSSLEIQVEAMKRAAEREASERKAEADRVKAAYARIADLEDQVAVLRLLEGNVCVCVW